MENYHKKQTITIEPPGYVHGWDRGGYYGMVFRYLKEIGAEIVIDVDKIPSQILCDGVTVEPVKDPLFQAMNTADRLGYTKFRLEIAKARRESRK